MRLFRYAWGTALLVGAGLTQIGEFSFVLVQVAKTAGHVSEDVYNPTLPASLLSIPLNAPLVRYAPGWIATLHFRMGRGSLPIQGGVADDQTGHVVLCGFGRMGSALTKLDLMTIEADDITASRVVQGEVEGLDPSEPIT